MHGWTRWSKSESWKISSGACPKLILFSSDKIQEKKEPFMSLASIIGYKRKEYQRENNKRACPNSMLGLFPAWRNWMKNFMSVLEGYGIACSTLGDPGRCGLDRSSKDSDWCKSLEHLVLEDNGYDQFVVKKTILLLLLGNKCGRNLYT